MVPVRSEYECYLNAVGKGSLEPVHIPRLMKIYLNYQAKICSQPAIDRRFKTIDFLTIIDISVLPEQSLNFFSKQRS
jgi:putative hemolysin